jgi:hypothetical protein
MKRLGRAVFLFAALLVSAFSPSCGSDNPPVADLGKSGESCQSHTDCGSGLRCFNNVCTLEDQTGTSDGGADGSLVVRSQKGESCAARIDCVLGLLCVNNVCVEGAGGDGGQTGVGERGESCRSRADCAAGLACVGGVCSKTDFGITPSNRECAVIACQVPKDCCPKVFSTSCPIWQSYCTDAGLEPYCQLYRSQCTCVEEMYLCTPDNRCTTRGTCSDASSMCAGGFVCNNGTECVRCVKDADCGNAGQVCTPDHNCATSCKDSKDCIYTQVCQAGACIDATGTCTTDRECVAQSIPPNPLSVCRAGRCKTPCETDLQCYVNGVYQYRACVNGGCEDIGCTTDEECRFRLRQPVTLNSSTIVVCRDKARDSGM